MQVFVKLIASNKLNLKRQYRHDQQGMESECQFLD